MRENLTGKDESGEEQNLFYSSTHSKRSAQLKSHALHEYRDQERQATRDFEQSASGKGGYTVCIVGTGTTTHSCSRLRRSRSPCWISGSRLRAAA
jgi:hypothetical protein